MDGIEAASVIRAWEKERQEKGNMRKQIPIIALTANAVVGMREMFMENGFDDFLSKPIDVSKLDEILNRWIPEEKSVKNKEQRIINNEQLAINNSSLPVIPGVDVKKGITLTGGTLDSYKHVLSMFCNDIEKRLPHLEKMREANPPSADDLSLFVINVHALKSSSASIGAGQISAKAAELEAEGKKENINFIREHLPAFAQMLIELIKNVHNVPQLKETAVPDLKSPIVYSSLFNELAEALKKQNTADIDRIIAVLGEKQMDAKTKKTLQEISDDVLMTEFDSALNKIVSLIDGRTN